MATKKIKLNENCVYKDDISIICTDILSKFAWYGQTFYFFVKKPEIYIPANGHGWKWIIDHEYLGLDKCCLKLRGPEESVSYLALHYGSIEAAPVPWQFGLNLPEFLGNYVAVTVEDKGCRVKSFLQESVKPFYVDDYKIQFKDLTLKSISVDIDWVTEG